MVDSVERKTCPEYLGKNHFRLLIKVNTLLSQLGENLDV